VAQQAQQLASLVIEAEQENFDKSMENLTKHCNEYVSTIFKTLSSTKYKPFYI
jgi:hypothetical protein